MCYGVQIWTPVNSVDTNNGVAITTQQWHVNAVSIRTTHNKQKNTSSKWSPSSLSGIKDFLVFLLMDLMSAAALNCCCCCIGKITINLSFPPSFFLTHFLLFFSFESRDDSRGDSSTGFFLNTIIRPSYSFGHTRFFLVFSFSCFLDFFLINLLFLLTYICILLLTYIKT